MVSTTLGKDVYPGGPQHFNSHRKNQGQPAEGDLEAFCSGRGAAVGKAVHQTDEFFSDVGSPGNNVLAWNRLS